MKKKRVRLSKKQKARKRRAMEAALRLIARQDHITIKEARKRYKDALVEVIFTRPTGYATRKFIQISPGKFREVPKGKPMREIYAEGPIRSRGYVEKVIKLKRYWEYVRLIAQEYDLTIKEARQKIKRKELTLEEIYRFYFAPREKKA